MIKLDLSWTLPSVHFNTIYYWFSLKEFFLTFFFFFRLIKHKMMIRTLAALFQCMHVAIYWIVRINKQHTIIPIITLLPKINLANNNTYQIVNSALNCFLFFHKNNIYYNNHSYQYARELKCEACLVVTGFLMNSWIVSSP